MNRGKEMGGFKHVKMFYCTLCARLCIRFIRRLAVQAVPVTNTLQTRQSAVTSTQALFAQELRTGRK